MMAFTLSKINLLILVTALFAIIVFFTFTLNDAFLVQKANLVADKIATETSSVISSSAHCAKNRVVIPSDLGIAGGRKLFYVLYVSKIDLLESFDSGEKLFALQFSLLKREKTLSKIIASTRLNVKAEEIYIFNVGDYGDKTAYGVDIDVTGAPDDISAVIDPQSNTPINAFVIAKEIKDGKANIFIVPCPALLCQTFANPAACSVANITGSGCPEQLFKNHVLGECLAYE